MNDLLDQLSNPVHSSEALLALMMKGAEGAQLLADYLGRSKPSCLPEARLLAVEGLGTLKGPEALDALITVACEHLDAIEDPVVRLAEETVRSRAAEALGNFRIPRAREVLLELLKQKPLFGVAEAMVNSWDMRAIPGLIAWLEDDFVADAAAKALRQGGRFAFAPLVDSLREKTHKSENEPRISKRRRARILEILTELLRPQEVALIEDLLDDSDDKVRANAAGAILANGSEDQQTRAYQSAIGLLDSNDSVVRTLAEDLLVANLEKGSAMIEREIAWREGCGESAGAFFPHESTLRILQRIRRIGASSSRTSGDSKISRDGSGGS